MSSHIPVMVEECLSLIRRLNKKDKLNILDCTFGLGGHTRHILENIPNSFVTGIDRDPTVSIYANIIAKEFPGRFKFINNRFDDALDDFQKNMIEKFDFILADFGVSSLQLDTKDRGFSFQSDAILDMRMNNSEGISALDFIQNSPFEEIRGVLRFGEEQSAHQIAKEIIKQRDKIKTTLDLANLVQKCVGYRKKNPATKTFQAIRMHINEEIESIKNLLDKIPNMLNPEGIFTTITFHSIEDRIVKHKMREWSIHVNSNRHAPLTESNIIANFIEKLKKPSESEMLFNPRSRSAILRAIQKI
jgi:16S rRNA (cytosine1402-N4)-methyltransferase